MSRATSCPHRPQQKRLLGQNAVGRPQDEQALNEGKVAIGTLKGQPSRCFKDSDGTAGASHRGLSTCLALAYAEEDGEEPKDRALILTPGGGAGEQLAGGDDKGGQGGGLRAGYRWHNKRLTPAVGQELVITA